MNSIPGPSPQKPCRGIRAEGPNARVASLASFHHPTVQILSSISARYGKMVPIAAVGVTRNARNIKDLTTKLIKSRDERYAEIVLSAIRVCRDYKPKFGAGGAGLTLEQFRDLYGSDPFYSWMGLDSPLMYSAHKAAGGMTSVYRQIGIGCQYLFVAILMDELGLTATEAAWSYSVEVVGAKKLRTLSLDARIPLKAVRDEGKREAVRKWMLACAAELKVDSAVAKVLDGAVFEVRQGYKSKDSKRQNADLANAATAYTQRYLPVVLLLSAQIDTDLALRYAASKWAILRGTVADAPTRSTYEFCKTVLGFDLAAFFKRHSPQFKAEIEAVLKALLSA